MQKRLMNTTSDRLSILGFGLMRLPTTSEGKIDEPQALEMMQYAYEHGINYFDTAVPYHNGESEILLGKFLKTIDRAKIKIATKLPCWLIKSHEDMEMQLNQQLEKLQTDHIDYYLLHALNARSWKNLLDNDVFSFIAKAKSDGKIINIGFSFHDDYKTFRKIVDAFKWDFCQVQLNYIDTHEQAGLRGMRYAATKGLGIIVMEPLKGGKIVANIPPNVQKIWDRSALKVSLVERALQWVWNLPEVTLLLSGMSSLKQVKENIRLAGKCKANLLTEKEINIYKAVRRAYLKMLPVNCTGCRYCLPCPNKVMIPFNLGIYMEAHLFGDIARHKMEYNMFVPDEGKADKCTNCGACISKCPQQINIPEMLTKVKDYFA